MGMMLVRRRQQLQEQISEASNAESEKTPVEINSESEAPTPKKPGRKKK